MSLNHQEASSFRLSAPRAARAAYALGVLGVSVAVMSVAAPSAAQPALERVAGPQNYGLDCLSPNDDGSSPRLDLTTAFPSGLRFFSETHTEAYVNTNGNITFSGPLSTFTPNAFPVAAQPMIAPFWADVDIRPSNFSCGGYSQGTTCTSCTPCNWEETPGGNVVWWYLEPGRMIVTWDRVGYYDCSDDRRMTFQLILTAAEDTGESCGGGAGDFDVEFRYSQCEWETGDASGGSGGFGGTPAQAGFDAGDTTNYVAISGSLSAGISRHLCDDSNVGITGVWRFQIRSGSVICPDAGDSCSTGLDGICGEGRTACVASGTQCVQLNSPAGELCDALDNDCDGQTDEGDGLCGTYGVCERGRCVDHCFEGSCDEGLTCDDTTGFCVDPACAGVTCASGQRCEGGTCLGACDGIVCPSPTTCVGGACVDVRASISCDPACEVCEDGTCVGRCDQGASCAAGETCDSDGRCVESACAAISCPTGTTCSAGVCVDPCDTATCPRGQTCEAGRCTGGNEIDAGTPIVGDGGVGTPGYRAADEGCGCANGATPSGSSGWVLLFVMGALGLRRRRR